MRFMAARAVSSQTQCRLWSRHDALVLIFSFLSLSVRHIVESLVTASSIPCTPACSNAISTFNSQHPEDRMGNDAKRRRIRSGVAWVDLL